MPIRVRMVKRRVSETLAVSGELARRERVMAKSDELRDMSDEQLGLTLKDAVENLFRLQIQSQTERLDAPSELRRNRRLVARIKTIQNQRTKKAAAVAAASCSLARVEGLDPCPRRQIIGVVTGDKMNKTRRVEIDRLVRHAKYGKFLRRRTVCHVHDENNESQIGDTVEIIEAPPRSKLEALGPGADRVEEPAGGYRGHAGGSQASGNRRCRRNRLIVQCDAPDNRVASKAGRGEMP